MVLGVDVTSRDSSKSTDSDEAILELDDISKTYGRETAVSDVSLSVRKGELFTLLGPSGCGKTTLLRLIAGLERPGDGSIRVSDERISGPGTFVEPDQRDIGLVFQDFALFPHLTAAENVGFGLPDVDSETRETRVDELLDLVGLQRYRDQRPDQLSGGQRQRIALARSLAPEPAVLLLDEPFSNLDVSLRERMREEVRTILKETGVTAVSVTHDQEEALSISDRVAVMQDGMIEQVGRPESVFQHPRSRFVAEFIGQAVFLSGLLQNGQVRTELGSFEASKLKGISREYEGASIDVLVRPDDLRAIPVEEGEGNGRIITRKYTGPSFVYGVELDSGEIVHCQENHATEFDLDRRVTVELTADHTLGWFPAA